MSHAATRLALRRLFPRRSTRFEGGGIATPERLVRPASQLGHGARRRFLPRLLSIEEGGRRLVSPGWPFFREQTERRGNESEPARAALPRGSRGRRPRLFSAAQRPPGRDESTSKGSARLPVRQQQEEEEE
ncbi:hypothetical protein JRQ81_001715, partial [Phrynocephalus forsythii]